MINVLKEGRAYKKRVSVLLVAALSALLFTVCANRARGVGQGFLPVDAGLFARVFGHDSAIRKRLDKRH